MDKVKIFKDSIHGYIEIPNAIVSGIIDTEQFQRLRYIEQTSMRSLYPAARHDRFIHSLGVYYLGQKAFSGFMTNSKKVISSLHARLSVNLFGDINDSWWHKQRLLFELACLMHDCAHAPFSHTLEQYYHLKKNSDGTPQLVENLIHLCKDLGDTSFETDLYSPGKTNWLGAPHEQLSAFIILKEYQETIKSIFDQLLPDVGLKNTDYVFICRMIIGCRYSEHSIENSLKNCIISLLNSSTIDVDGLDYIVRDAQMSGISAYNIDYQRILNSFTIIPVKIFDDICVDELSIKGVWLKDTQFEISSFSGMVWGKFNLEGKDLVKSLLYKSNDGDFYLSDKYVISQSDTSKVQIVNAIDGRIQLRSSAKIINSKFSGLVHGMKIVEPEDELDENLAFVLGYDKRCLSVIQNTIDARNNEYLWIYTHPKVLYNSNFLQCRLLDVASEYLSRKIRKKDKTTLNQVGSLDCITQILGYEEFYDQQDTALSRELKEEGYYFKRSNDNDINALFKRIYLETLDNGDTSDVALEFQQLYKDYYGRKQRRILWKSFMEEEVFLKCCNGSSGEAKGISKLLSKIVDESRSNDKAYKMLESPEKDIFENYNFFDVLVINSEAKTKAIDFSDFFVRFDKRIERLCDVIDPNMMGAGVKRSVEYIYFSGEACVDNNVVNRLNEDLSNLYAETRKTEVKNLKGTIQ